MIKYKVSGNIVKYKDADNIGLHSWTEEFTDENPIIAREKAIKYYKDILAEIKEAGEKIEDKLTRGGDTFEDLDLSIGVYLEIEDPYDKIWDGIDIELGQGLGRTEIEDSKMVWTEIGGYDEDDFSLDPDDYSLMILGIGAWSSPQWLVKGLENEIIIYDFLSYEKKGFEAKARCFDHNDGKIKEYRILKIPFDWNEHSIVEQQSNEKKIKQIEMASPEDIIETAAPEVIKYVNLIKKGEVKNLEFKSTLCFCENKKTNENYIKFAVAKTIAAFLNTDGGLLFIGINDKKEIIGLENDYRMFNSEDKKDSFLKTFANTMKTYIGNGNLPNIKEEFLTYNGLDFMVVKVFPSSNRVYLTNEKKEKEFYVRSGSTSQKLDVEECVIYALEKLKNKK